MIPAFESTRIGLTKPNSRMDAAIWATCSDECVRAFLAYGTSRSVGHNSIRCAIAGVIELFIRVCGAMMGSDRACGRRRGDAATSVGAHPRPLPTR